MAEVGSTPDFSTGVMLCLRPTNPESLVIPGGMEVSDIHCTLFYFGNTDEFDYSAAEQLKEVLGAEVVPGSSVLEGEITAITEFGTQGEAPALVLLVDAPGLGEFRASTLRRIRPALGEDSQPYTNHDFCAHITVAWSPTEDDVAAAQALVGHPVRFEVMDLEWGTESSRWDLGSEGAISDSAMHAGLLLGEELTAFAHQETTVMAEATTTEAPLGDSYAETAEFLVAVPVVPPTEVVDPNAVDEEDTADAGTKVKVEVEVEVEVADPDDESGDEPDDQSGDQVDPNVTASMRVAGAAAFTAIPAHSTPTTDSREFDGDTAKTRTRSGEAPAYYNKIYAWHDAGNSPGNKTGYKFPHHLVSEAGDPGAAVTWAVKAALMLIDDSVIPKSDQKGVFNHLAGHLRDAGVDVPDLGSDNASTDDVMAAVALAREQFATEGAAEAAEETKVETPASEALADVVATAPAAAPVAPAAALDIKGLNDADLLSEFMRRYLESVATKPPTVAAASTNTPVAEFAAVGDPQPDVAAEAGYQWAAVLIPEGVPSGDGRMIENLALTWRELPLPLMLQTVNAEGHSGSVICGSIKEIQRINNNIVGLGDFDPGTDGQRALSLLTAGTMRGVSADIDSVMMELRDENNRPVSRKQLAAAGEEGIRAVEVLVSGRIMGACYDEKTEILTENFGWLKFADLPRDERVATLNQKTHEMEYQEPIAYTDDPWDGRMIQFTSGGVQKVDGDPAKFHRSLDLLVTPNHRMYVESTKTGERSFMRADELIEKSHRSYIFPKTSEWDREDVEMVYVDSTLRGKPSTWTMPGDDYAALMGAYLSEGCRQGDKATFIAQQPTSKGRSLFQALADRIGMSASNRGFTFHDSRFSRYVAQFGTATHKFVPEEVKNLSSRQIRIFLDHYIAGDGDLEGRRIYTSSVKMAGDLQELAQKVGMWAVVSELPMVDRVLEGRTITPTAQPYVVALRNRPGSRSAANCHDWKAEWVEEHVGTVHCVTVPNETLLVRRNGIPTWCGNTICPFPAFQEASITVLSPDVAQQDEVLVASGADVQGEVWRVNSSVPFVVVGVHDMFDLTESIVASAGVTELPVIPVNPPADWFSLEPMDHPVPFTVYPNGRCYGLIAQFGTCHIGNRNKCVDVPRSSNNYGYFRNKNTLSAEGTMIATGPIIMDTVHPSLKLRASDAQAFYAHNGCAVADVALYENEFGIVACGAARPDSSPEEMRRFRGSSISGDWRKINGKLELVGALSVNVPGFPIEALVASGADDIVESMEPRGLYNSVSDDMESLVAAGAITEECSTCTSGSVDGDAIVAIAEQLAAHTAMLSDLTRVTRPLRLEQAAARIAEMTARRETLSTTEAIKGE